ncbi:RNA polymerase sigma factor [Actinacidiphila acidipaludis]|uniref:RNA polymerase sigma factor n=1 Tax=Actinacidiphila acidipaludis TaxID=2873382 RepID=A0ABS7Q9F7_9ACTN|nr:RNA polymerase sigma factor [Streptomyces acidipaludis]MBY8879789.1 RNA polymerase sigma factor [Streptomyces acidipaludis]
MGRAEVRRRDTTDDAEFGAALAKAREGDEAAFGTVYRALNPRLVGYLHGLVGHDADDVASETWHDIVRGLGDFRGEGPAFRAWAATIARHRALDHLRRLKVRPRTTELEDGTAEPPAERDSEGLALENLSTAHALSLIAELPRDQAEAVLLRVMLGLNAPMAAKVLGKQPGAVRTAAHRGLKRLADRLGRTGGAEEE